MDAEQRIARYKSLMARQYDAMVKSRRFNIGDLVLKRVSLATRNPAHGKLGQLIRKDLIGSSTSKGRDRTIWKPLMDESWNTLGMLSI